MISQLEFLPSRLDLTADAERLIAHLLSSPGWHHASDILDAWAIPDTESFRRRIRALAAQAEPDVISGQQGYRHIDHASAEEIHHFVAWMESQARSMTARAEAIRRRAHALIGA